MADNDKTRDCKMTDATKNGRILNAESRRFDIISDIEDALDNYSLHTGNKSLAKRKHQLGKAPNDWQK